MARSQQERAIFDYAVQSYLLWGKGRGCVILRHTSINQASHVLRLELLDLLLSSQSMRS